MGIPDNTSNTQINATEAGQERDEVIPDVPAAALPRLLVLRRLPRCGVLPFYLQNPNSPLPDSHYSVGVYPAGNTGPGGGLPDTQWLEGEPYRECRVSTGLLSSAGPGHPGHRLPASVPVLRAQAGGDTFLSLPWHARPPDGVRLHLCRYLLQSQLNLLTFCYCCIK